MKLELKFDHFLLKFVKYQYQIILKILDHLIMIIKHLKIFVNFLQIDLIK
jgi:hypothetical protein